MRTKDELLTESSRAISKAPKEGQEMLAHEFLMLEVFIDIRDILVTDVKLKHDLVKAFSEIA